MAIRRSAANPAGADRQGQQAPSPIRRSRSSTRSPAPPQRPRPAGAVRLNTTAGPRLAGVAHSSLFLRRMTWWLPDACRLVGPRAGGPPRSSSTRAGTSSRSELCWRQELAGRRRTGHRRGIPAGEPQHLTVLGGPCEQIWLAGPGDVHRVTAVPAEPGGLPAVLRWHEPHPGLSRRGRRAERLADHPRQAHPARQPFRRQPPPRAAPTPAAPATPERARTRPRTIPPPTPPTRLAHPRGGVWRAGYAGPRPRHRNTPPGSTSRNSGGISRRQLPVAANPR